jgi:hypothetical protein
VFRPNDFSAKAAALKLGEMARRDKKKQFYQQF